MTSWQRSSLKCRNSLHLAVLSSGATRLSHVSRSVFFHKASQFLQCNYGKSAIWKNAVVIRGAAWYRHTVFHARLALWVLLAASSVNRCAGQSPSSSRRFRSSSTRAASGALGASLSRSSKALRSAVRSASSAPTRPDPTRPERAASRRPHLSSLADWVYRPAVEIGCNYIPYKPTQRLRMNLV